MSWVRRLLHIHWYRHVVGVITGPTEEEYAVILRCRCRMSRTEERWVL